ncbi:hypothetical protein [Dysgonomonas sp. GY75]|uniref:hypothetical protein n=1 Tax=Dysgonomonas sp. GY75 TaxID=2780419 RepID=UPI0018F042F7|nr:hypothetical protein [Dysgonomonas sp. GY75]
MKLDFDEAVNLLKNKGHSLTERDKRKRELLLAAFDNLIEFAAAEEIRMISELPEIPDRKNLSVYQPICKKYNLKYATQENEDVLHAVNIAFWWIGVPEECLVTFMTQGDERVRAWHLSYEGLSFPKNNFPPELIPPIEFGCRCYLITNGFGSVYGSADKKKAMIKETNPVFKESLAKGGRIFSLEHPYFRGELPEYAKDIVYRIKRKLGVI